MYSWTIRSALGSKRGCPPVTEYHPFTKPADRKFHSNCIAYLRGEEVGFVFEIPYPSNDDSGSQTDGSFISYIQIEPAV